MSGLGLYPFKPAATALKRRWNESQLISASWSHDKSHSEYYTHICPHSSQHLSKWNEKSNWQQLFKKCFKVSSIFFVLLSGFHQVYLVIICNGPFGVFDVFVSVWVQPAVDCSLMPALKWLIPLSGPDQRDSRESALLLRHWVYKIIIPPFRTCKASNMLQRSSAMVSSNRQDRLITAIKLTYISLFNTSNKLCCEENNSAQKLCFCSASPQRQQWSPRIQVQLQGCSHCWT